MKLRKFNSHRHNHYESDDFGGGAVEVPHVQFLLSHNLLVDPSLSFRRLKSRLDYI